MNLILDLQILPIRKLIGFRYAINLTNRYEKPKLLHSIFALYHFC